MIYCKFWELDTDHDFLIDKENLIRYGNHSLTYRIVDRIFSQVYPSPQSSLSLWDKGEVNYILISVSGVIGGINHNPWSLVLFW